VDLLDAAQTVGGAKTFTSAQNAFTGSGAGLTALNGTAVAAGTVADARLTANVALLGRTPQAFAGINTFAGAVGIGTATPAAGALLDLTSTTQAFLPPRMTKAQRDAIPGANLVAGMVLFNTDDGALNIYNGTAWTNDVRGGPAYIKLGMSNYQGPSYICNCTVATGHTISFDTLRYKSKLTNSSNGINLKAGHTYRLEASVSLYVASGNQYLGYRFYNATAAAEFGEGCYTGLSASSAAQYGFKPQCLEIYTPSADVNIQVRVNDGNIGTAGLISPNYNTYFMATEM
jgi:hypothetical protein